ncbi:MAG: transcriptional regulator [Herbinix sp.]|jgi:hypothetical protein|nr:transcriptional regulator [Herbinix sp.]
MNLDLENCSIEDLTRGFTIQASKGLYQCLHCSAKFETGEIYLMDGHYYEAFRAVKEHIIKDHGDLLIQLLHSESKYNTITDKQKELLALIGSGMSDQEIAGRLAISASTVRHQKFTFREKAKQAKLYLAMYELMNEKFISEKDILVPIHEGATMVDDRYFTTKEENDKILATVFESLSPLKLKIFSSKEKKKIVTLRKIMEQFEKGKIYTEKEVNGTLKSIYEDYPTIRRYLIEYGFMERSKDCKQYWVK